MLLVEALVLVLHEVPGTRSLRFVMHGSAAHGGAILLDLVARGRVTVSKRVGAPVATVVDPTPTGEDVLDSVLERMSTFDRGAEVRHAVVSSRLDQRWRVRQRLAAAGILRTERYKAWRVIPSERTVLVDSAPVEAIRATLRGVVVDGHAADWYQAALVGILDELGVLATVLGDTGLSDRALRRRARDVAPDDVAVRAVRGAIKRPGKGMDHGEPGFGLDGGFGGGFD